MNDRLGPSLPSHPYRVDETEVVLAKLIKSLCGQSESKGIRILILNTNIITCRNCQVPGKILSKHSFPIRFQGHLTYYLLEGNIIISSSIVAVSHLTQYDNIAAVVADGMHGVLRLHIVHHQTLLRMIIIEFI